MTQTAAAATTNSTITTTGTRGWWSRRPWLGMFLGGLTLWVATVVVTFVTGNVNLVPSIILLGSFLIPVTFVTYAFGRTDEVVTPSGSSARSSTAACSVSWARRSWNRRSSDSPPA